MATWDDFAAAAPELAAAARELFEAHTHLTIATLRKDGAPRISGIEAQFLAGDLWFGSMPERGQGAATSSATRASRCTRAPATPPTGTATRRSPAAPRRSPTRSG